MILESSHTDEVEELIPRKHRFPIQWNLRTLLLLTAAVAVWAGYISFHQQCASLEQEISPLRRMARSLIIEDRRQFAVVNLQELWSDEDRWDIHLPDGVYAIRMATREITEEGLAPVVEEATISAGRHRIEFRRSDDEDGEGFTVLVDGQQSIKANEEPDWRSDNGFHYSAEFEDCTQLPPSEPAILFRGRFSVQQEDGVTTIPETPTNGILLWIERVSH